MNRKLTDEEATLLLRKNIESIKLEKLKRILKRKEKRQKDKPFQKMRLNKVSRSAHFKGDFMILETFLDSPGPLKYDPNL